MDEPPNRIALSARGGVHECSRCNVDQIRPHERKGLVFRLGKLSLDEYDHIVKAMKERLNLLQGELSDEFVFLHVLDAVSLSFLFYHSQV